MQPPQAPPASQRAAAPRRVPFWQQPGFDPWQGLASVPAWLQQPPTCLARGRAAAPPR